MRDWSGGLGVQDLLVAETLGLEMARRAARILAKHREALARIGQGPAGSEILESPEFQADNVIFTAILDAANECLGYFDRRPAEQRWCDALLRILELAEAVPMAGVSAP